MVPCSRYVTASSVPRLPRKRGSASHISYLGPGACRKLGERGHPPTSSRIRQPGGGPRHKPREHQRFPHILSRNRSALSPRTLNKTTTASQTSKITRNHMAPPPNELVLVPAGIRTQLPRSLQSALLKMWLRRLPLSYTMKLQRGSTPA